MMVGVGCGLAAAGKYVGLLAVVFGLIVVPVVGKRAHARWVFWLTVFVASLMLVLVAANMPALGKFHALTSGFSLELNHSLTSHSGLTSFIWDPLIVSSVVYFCGPLACWLKLRPLDAD